MAVIARIIGLSLLTGALGAWLGQVSGDVLGGQPRDYAFLSLCIACVGGIIGAVAGAAREVVTALRQRPSS